MINRLQSFKCPRFKPGCLSINTHFPIAREALERLSAARSWILRISKDFLNCDFCILSLKKSTRRWIIAAISFLGSTMHISKWFTAGSVGEVLQRWVGTPLHVNRKLLLQNMQKNKATKRTHNPYLITRRISLHLGQNKIKLNLYLCKYQGFKQHQYKFLFDG